MSGVPGLTVSELQAGAVACIKLAVMRELDGWPETVECGQRQKNRIRRWGWDYSEPWKKWHGPAPDDIYFASPPGGCCESVTIHEYLPGHGLGMHRDSGDFDEPLWTLSLGASATMLWERAGGRVARVPLREGTVTRMEGEARWRWLHGMESDNDGMRWSVIYRRRVEAFGRSPGGERLDKPVGTGVGGAYAS